MSNGVDMMEVINTPAKNGRTLLNQAAPFSLTLSLVLMGLRVKVNSVNSDFITPAFHVSQQVCCTK